MFSPNGQDVGGVGLQVRRQLEGEGRVAAAIFAELVAVDGDGGCGHDAGKVHENAAAGLRRQLEVAAIDGDELEILFVETVPGEDLVGVRDGDALEFGVVEIRGGRARDRAPAEKPVPVHRQDPAEGAV